jgi:hypothetical protein
MDYIVSHWCNMQIMLWFIRSVHGPSARIGYRFKHRSVVTTYQFYFDITIAACFFSLLLFTIRFHTVRSWHNCFYSFCNMFFFTTFIETQGIGSNICFFTLRSAVSICRLVSHIYSFPFTYYNTIWLSWYSNLYWPD